MIQPELLSILRCPASGEQLTLASEALVDGVNEKIAQGSARDGLDATVAAPIDGGLMTAGGDRLYPIRGDVPTLIVDDAIRLA